MRIKRAGFVTGSHMRNTTLCYLERDGKYLMMHRVKKENDLNHNKWVGVGGKFEENESPEECVRVYRGYLEGASAAGAFTRGLYERGVE